MKIATLNIDWAKKSKSKSHFLKIESFLNSIDFDFLILSEAIDLRLQKYPFKYFSEQIPENIVYENLNYSEYLNGEKAFRTIIFSKQKSVKTHKVCDAKTSLAVEFETDFGNIIIYATIIGTWFNKQPFAEIELQNSINDCEKLTKINSNLFVIGDLNTSFLENEKEFTINSKTTNSLLQLFEKLNLNNATKDLKRNIDHIIIPNSFSIYKIDAEIFVEKDILSDHQGVCVSIT